MTPQERQLIDDLFNRLSKVESAPRDPDATAAMAQGLRIAPNAVYALVQTVLVQDEALRRANGRIQELESGSAPQQGQGGSFLDPARQTQSGGSVPNVPPPNAGSRPVWNSGQVLQQTSQGQGRYDQEPQGRYDQQYDQRYNSAQAPMGGGPMGGGPMGGGPMGGGPMGGAMGGGGSFLGTAAAAAAGAVGGSLLLNGIRSMMGGGHHAFGDQSNSNLARDAGINDVGSSHSRSALASQDQRDDLQADADEQDDFNDDESDTV